MSPSKKTAWDAAVSIIQILRDAGHTALLAGGCVRDRLLDLSPKDCDVATDARPDRLLQLFPRARRVGAKFGVILVRKYGQDVEVATFRSDGRYSDGRHPDEISLGTDRDDAKRRDFTINGMFFDPADGRVIDYVNGRADLERGIIRTIGDPQDRFAEDHLRMLRAVRFAARLDFAIDHATLEAIRGLAPHLHAISPERTWQELELILSPPSRVRGWSLLVATGLCHHLIEHWQPDEPQQTVATQRLEALPNRDVNASLALAALWCGDPPEAASKRARALRLSNRETHAVVWILRSLPWLGEPDSMELADFKTLMADPSWDDLLLLLRADEIARTGKADIYEAVRHRSAAIPPDQVAPTPLLTGDDLQRLGVQPGPQLGRILKQVYRAQLNEQIADAGEAEQMARGLIEGC